MSNLQLAGRTALVTGGSRGIGRAIAVALARTGADVVFTFRARADDAQATALAIEATGRRTAVVQADLTKREDIERLLHDAVQFGPIDILVNNAGTIRPQPLAEITAKDWDNLIAANLTSAFLIMQAVWPGMRERHWGRVINLSSVAA